MLIEAARLQDMISDIFVAAGCSAAESARIGLYLVRSNLTGHDSHGVVRVPRYLDLLKTGDLVRDQTLKVISRTETLAVVDGGYGFGQTIGPAAVELGIEMARAGGTAIVALRHSGHLGRIGEWAEMAAAAGLASVHFVNVAGSMLVAPFGGVERRFSTAPFAAGFPVPDGAPIILDFATSAVAEGKVLVAANGGKAIPPDSLITETGALSGNPDTLYGPATGGPRMAKNGKGAIRAFGEHKGSGLALFCELLAGALTGSGCAGPDERRFSNGMLSIYMAPARFGSPEAFSAETRGFVDFVKSTRPATPGGEVLLPGEPEARMRAERTRGGIPLPDEVWTSLAVAARAAGLSPERYTGSAS
jgi:uncharacterized oxidoreductase